MVTAETEVNRLNTSAFIAARPSIVSLIPQKSTKTGTGVRLTDLPARAPQVFRLVDQSGAMGPNPGVVQTGDGHQRKAAFQLIGAHDAEIELNDYWIAEDGSKLVVEELLNDNGYERRAMVVRYGI
jgi:hypothetical protein